MWAACHLRIPVNFLPGALSNNIVHAGACLRLDHSFFPRAHQLLSVGYVE